MRISPTHPMGVDEAERRIRGLRGPAHRPPHLHLHLKTSLRSGDLVLRTHDLAIGYPDEGRPLFHAPDLVLKRGECAALIGPNGAGKTTFLKTILGQLPPLAGEVLLGASLDIGYFAQAHEGLDPEQHPGGGDRDWSRRRCCWQLSAITWRASCSPATTCSSKVSTLSGGERGRLALAKLALTSANLLLLDEPTNHLDIPSQEILQEVLDDYQGTILLVSHDRYLIDALGTQIWEIEPGEASMRVFLGTYSQYRGWLEAQRVGRSQAGRLRSPKYLLPSAASADGKRRRQRLKEVEKQIGGLEARLAELAMQLENPPPDPARVQKIGASTYELQSEIEGLMKEWEALLILDPSRRDCGTLL